MTTSAESRRRSTSARWWKIAFCGIHNRRRITPLTRLHPLHAVLEVLNHDAERVPGRRLLLSTVMTMDLDGDNLGDRTCSECGRDPTPEPFEADGHIRVGSVCAEHGVHSVVSPSRTDRTA